MAGNSIKKVNLQQMQRPKTLIVIHYRGKRVSIPIFQSMENIVEYLWHQLQKFQNTILEAELKTKNSRSSYSVFDVVGFTAVQQEKNKLDIKMNILLSMSRLGKDYGKSRTDLKELDITNYYKYLEIEPYYGSNSKQLIPQYQLYSVLGKGQYYTTYLGRKISDGRFYSIKMCRGDSKLAQNQYNAMKIIHNEQLKFDRKFDLEIIPQVDEVRKTDGLFIFIFQYCPGGNLKYALRYKLSEIQCLHYMKQLVWGIHTLNSNFNLVHRAVCFENIEVDFVGNLRLMNYAYCQPCYANNYLAQSNVPQSYENRYEIENVISPPEVQRSGKYNNLVDYYGVGVVLQDMFTSGLTKSQIAREKEGIQIAIENLLAQNLRDRELFISEIISQLHEQKMKSYSNRSRSNENTEHQRLSFNKIYTGESINIEQRIYNGIKHEQAPRIMKPSNDDHLYFLNPVNKSRKKSKTKSKSKSKQKSQQMKEKNKSNKNKSRSKSKQKGQGHKNLIGANMTGLTKKSLKGSEKSLNKSIDSRNNSVKSNKSSQSRQKKKESTGNGIIQHHHQKRPMPKIPTPTPVSTVKSPQKNPPTLASTVYNPRSPPKLIINKSKNRL